jgi:hypothetical protein
MSSWSNNTLIKRNSEATKLEPLFSKNDKEMFYRYLSKATTYFEYGSGGSTYQASLRKNLVKIYSVESDLVWHTKLKKIINNSSVKFIFSEMDTKQNTYGNPGPNSSREDWIKYSSQICNLDSEDSKVIDFILIDGRFRVACCLKCFDLINSECFIAFDDFLNRPYYHIVLDYYDIIEQTADNRMVILKKKSNISVPREVIEKYELDKN